MVVIKSDRRDGSVSQPAPTLCRPTSDLACFGCCPPIRPPGYDPLDHRAELIPDLERAAGDAAAGRTQGSIDGRSCWGLGFTNPDQRLVGCLLHPLRYQGRDLRRVTGYAEKCAREICPQSAAFTALSAGQRAAVVAVARRAGADRDSFLFSSPRANPVHTLLLWGADALETLWPVWADDGPLLNRLSVRLRPGDALTAHPRARAWVFARAAGAMGPEALNNTAALSALEAATRELALRLRPVLASPLANLPFVHRLGLEPLTADFIRLGLGLPRLEKERSADLTARMEGAVPELVRAVEEAVD